LRAEITLSTPARKLRSARYTRALEAHLLHRDAAGLAESHILDPELLEGLEVVPGSKAAVERRLARRPAVELLLALHHAYRQLRVRRVALLNHQIEDEVRGPDSTS
jgi:hypothetical protein